MPPKSEYKDQNTFEKRKAESQRIRDKFPDRIPIIVEHAKADKTDMSNIDKNKYLVPSDLTVGQFTFVIRKRIKLAPAQTLFIFINDTLAPTAALMAQMYKEHKDEDGFLYCYYAGMDHFGSAAEFVE